MIACPVCGGRPVVPPRSAVARSCPCGRLFANVGVGRNWSFSQGDVHLYAGPDGSLRWGRWELAGVAPLGPADAEALLEDMVAQALAQEVLDS